MHLAPLRNHRHLVSELALQLHAEWGDLPPWSDRHTIERRLLDASVDAVFPYAFIALTEDGQFAGTASVKLRELEGHFDKEHWLGEVFVRADLRGRGLGSLLVSEGVRYAFGAGAAALYLYTPDQQALYARLGWHECEEAKVNGEIVTIMVKHRDA